MEREQKINMKSRIRTSRNNGVGGVHLTKHEYSKRVLIHQHMMSHYRRLYNAKCGVDTSAPSHFKPRYKPQPRPLVSSLSIQNQLSVNDMKFLESISSDMRMWGDRNTSRHCLLHWEENNCLENLTNQSRLEKCKKCASHEFQLIPCGCHSDSTANVVRGSKPMKKIESKVDMKKNPVNISVPSKLREMSVYHPPRKRLMEKTPCKHCACCSSVNTHHVNEVNKSLSHKNNVGNYNLNAEMVSVVMGAQKEKLMYLQFVQNITQDILYNEMFSNDDLEEICKKHIQLNEETLEMDKMMEQIQILKKQLGIYEEPSSSSKTDTAHVLSNCVDAASSDPKSFENISFGTESKLSFYPFFEVHQSEESLNNENCKRNFEDDERSVIKKHQICKSDESNLFNLLTCIGFDSNIAEEICMGMKDQEDLRSTFVHYKTSDSKFEVPDFSGPYEIGEFSRKSNVSFHDSHYCSCMLPKNSKVSDPNFVNAVQGEKTVRNQDNAQQKVGGRKYNSPMDKKVKQNPLIKSRQPYSQKKKIIAQNSKLSLSGSDIVYDDSDKQRGTVTKTISSLSTNTLSNEDLKDVKERSKDQIHRSNEKENSSAPKSVVSSPVASDYSSMKDHEESVSEVYSVGEASDEGRESASEVEEDIPDDVSQTTASSGISQLTEKFKSISVNVGS